MHALMSPDFGRVEETPSAAVDKEANSHLSPSEQNFGVALPVLHTPYV